ncbi:hypothetical protein SH501x_005064 [Pirellulaceae bacterium SH501]
MTAHLSYLRKSLYLLGSLVLLSMFSDLPLLNAQERPCPASQQSSGLDRYFEREVWPKVVEAECLKCHNMVGDAKDTRLVFRDLLQASPKESQDWLRCNGELLKQAADWESDGGSMLLAKVTGGLSHGGEVVLKPDSTAYRILEQFVRRVKDPTSQPLTDTVETDPQRPFFEGVEMLDDRRLLRRAVLSLAGRLPTDAEVAAVKDQGLDAMHSILDGVMQEEAFYERIREAFNDIFLTEGIDGNADSTVLSYEHFEKSRLWYQKHDLSHIEDAKERQQASYKLANEYRAALLGEPMKLIEYIIRHDRPFTEIVTADYIMVSPYSARGYGIYDEVKERFADPDDPFEYIPVKLKALVGRNKSENQESASGFYPHAGILSTFQYLSRYPTTETNRNRLRARMFYQHFLGVDVLELAARGSDAAAVTAKFEVPTMQAAECVVCHKTLDPVAGLFQDYWRFDANFAIYGRRKEGWFTDMFGAGFEGEGLPADERWRALAWLGEKTAKDPRFAIAMSEHAYYVLTGRRLLQPPKDIDDPMFAARRRAYQTQRKVDQAIAARFVESGFSFKQLIKDWVVSDFYRADGLKASENSLERLMELDDVGVVRLLSPEQLERKIKAVFGKRWGRLNEQTAMLYGGIDSKEVTERATDPSGAMGAIQRTLANDVACRNVALDFSRSASERILFPTIEPDVTPGNSEDLDRRIRLAIVHLHERILGQYDHIDSPEVDRTFALFSGIVDDAKKQGSAEPQEIWSCRQGLEQPVPDPHYTVRAWRAVVTYLLRRREFLYE